MPTQTLLPRAVKADAQAALACYIHGFKRGVCGSAFDRLMESNEDFMAGYRAGRTAMLKASLEASQHYGADLSPLRS